MILACDPGIRGAFAWTDGFALSVRDMPKVSRLAGARHKPRDFISEDGVERLLRSAHLHTQILVIEQVGGMPGQSGPAAFVFGYGVGLVTGIAQSLGYRIERVAPARWKGALGVSADKNRARVRATELWPRQAGLWTRKMDDGRAEAAMLALYGWQVFGPGEEPCLS